ncbi:hypothetical protein ACFFX0_03320 [Citricoccus parietis]|uniref:Uncharacterized protein n=1 Tax=Citricoccus parietis TaxID=592307 RepID=A0ABV5FUA4_9MICC
MVDRKSEARKPVPYTMTSTSWSTPSAVVIPVAPRREMGDEVRLTFLRFSAEVQVPSSRTVRLAYGGYWGMSCSRRSGRSAKDSSRNSVRPRRIPSFASDTEIG